MSGQQSIADMAVSALAAIQGMDEGMGVVEPERHAIREMKRAAEQAITDACRLALSIAWASRTVRKVASELTATQQQQGKDGE